MLRKHYTIDDWTKAIGEGINLKYLSVCTGTAAIWDKDAEDYALTKEVIKDVSGQKVYYYVVREDLSDVHDVYEESPNKVFDPPVEIEARVEYQPAERRTNKFGHEEFYTINVFFHERGRHRRSGRESSAKIIATAFSRRDFLMVLGVG